MGQRRLKKQATRKQTKKPSHQTDWKELEKIVARIEQDLAPDATVTHNDKVLGKSGRLRQLDVTVRKNIGSTPIFIVIECKHYTRVVGIEKVEQFSKKLEDVRASRGVMVSSTGFDAGGRAIASQNNILLRTHREAEETDWKKMIETVSVTVHDFDILNLKVLLKIQGIPQVLDVPIGTRLFKENGEDYAEGRRVEYAIKNVFWDSWENQIPRPRPLGPMEAHFEESSPPAFVKINNSQLLKVERIVLSGTIIVLQYHVPLSLVEGEVLEDSEAKKLEYLSVNTNSFDVSQIRENYEGVELTQEQWNEIEKRGGQGFNTQAGAIYRIKFTGGEE